MIVYVSSLTQGASILFHKINCRFIISFCTIPVRGRKHPGAFCHPFFKKLHENCVIVLSRNLSVSNLCHQINCHFIIVFCSVLVR